MVVGFVNSGIMSLRQAVGVIMGANIGTTMTSWIFSMTGIQSESFWVRMLKPSSFAPIVAMIGIIYATFLIGLGVIGVLAIVLRVLLELIKEQANEK